MHYAHNAMEDPGAFRDWDVNMELEQATALPLGGDIEVAATGVRTRPPPAVAQPRAPSRNEAARAALLTGPILATLLKLALPTMTVLLAQTAVNIAEAYYVGFLGTDALGALQWSSRSSC